MGGTVTAILLLAMGIGSLIISVRSFQEKGFCLNNAYLYASRQEREMQKLGQRCKGLDDICFRLEMKAGREESWNSIIKKS